MSKLNNQLIHEIDSYLNRLFPLNRSITGSGNREKLKILQEIIPLEIKELPSGLEVYDWIIPDKWHIRNAWIKNSQGNKIIDFIESNIHLVSYSEAAILGCLIKVLQKLADKLVEKMCFEKTYVVF